MSVVGTLVFCTDCGNLLDPAPGSDKLVCDACNAVVKDTATKTITTRSLPNAFPSALRLKRSAVQNLSADELSTEAKISQVCPECGHHEMWFHTAQLRGADEGATVFYRCANEKCNHRFNTNN